MVAEYMCPECGELFDTRGLHGHLKFDHGLSTEEATEAAREVRENPGSAHDHGSVDESVAENQPETGAGFGDVSEHVRQRLSEAADVEASIRMLEALDGGDEADEGDDRGPVDDLKGLIDAVVALDNLRGDSMGPDEIREVVRQEMPERAVADGGSADAVARAIDAGVNDPEQLAEIAKLDPANRAARAKWEKIESITEKILESGAVGSGLQSVATAAVQAFASGGSDQEPEQPQQAQQAQQVHEAELARTTAPQEPEQQPDPRTPEDQAAALKRLSPGRLRRLAGEHDVEIGEEWGKDRIAEELANRGVSL